MSTAKEITGKQREGLLTALQARFEAHRERHEELEWSAVRARLESNRSKLWSLNEMRPAPQ